MKIKEITEGDNRIGTALWRNSIPLKYKQYPVIGQGATSIVLDKGDGTVLVLTRDAMKRDWLVHNWGLSLGEWIDTVSAHHQKSQELSDMHVYVIQMPKLFPLSTNNKRVVKKAIDLYNISIATDKKLHINDKFNRYLEMHPEGLFAQLVEFLQNYDEKQYGVDFLMRNFMQDNHGNIILTDPIVSRDVVNALHAIVNKKWVFI